MKIEELHDLRIIMKSGAAIVTKGVRHWEFSTTSWKLKWANGKNANVSWIDPSEIAAVEILARKKRLVWS
jgi:hypothetical protein